MLIRQLSEIFDLLDRPDACGSAVADYLRSKWDGGIITVTPFTGPKGHTDFIRITIPGLDPKRPTIGILGRLGGIGARPAQLGFVSDGDGALCALACCAKLLEMAAMGDRLPGTVVVCTHICPNAPVVPHEPVPFMGAPVDMETVNRAEVDGGLSAILSVDTTRGNRLLNRRGFAITPTVRDGYILRVSESLLDVVERVTGEQPSVMPITMQDITPYGNGIYHVNSILQPATATDVPVVGVAITAATAVPGCGTGACDMQVCEVTARFLTECAKDYALGRLSLSDDDEFERMKALYGSMSILRTK